MFGACLLAGLALVSGGVAWRFTPADGVITFGAGMVTLTFLALRILGRRE